MQNRVASEYSADGCDAIAIEKVDEMKGPPLQHGIVHARSEAIAPRT